MIMISSRGGNTCRASLTSLMLSYTFVGYHHRKGCFRCSGLPPPPPARASWEHSLGPRGGIGARILPWPVSASSLTSQGNLRLACGGNQAFVTPPLSSPSPLASELPRGGGLSAHLGLCLTWGVTEPCCASVPHLLKRDPDALCSADVQ